MKTIKPFYSTPSANQPTYETYDQYLASLQVETPSCFLYSSPFSRIASDENTDEPTEFFSEGFSITYQNNSEFKDAQAALLKNLKDQQRKDEYESLRTKLRLSPKQMGVFKFFQQNKLALGFTTESFNQLISAMSDERTNRQAVQVMFEILNRVTKKTDAYKAKGIKYSIVPAYQYAELSMNDIQALASMYQTDEEHPLLKAIIEGEEIKSTRLIEYFEMQNAKELVPDNEEPSIEDNNTESSYISEQSLEQEELLAQVRDYYDAIKSLESHTESLKSDLRKPQLPLISKSMRAQISTNYDEISIYRTEINAITERINNIYS